VTLSAPDVSVIIPTRNGGSLLDRTLRGALAQRGVEIEVVVVDDASSDDTRARVARVPDDRVRVLSHEQQRGVSAARNTGIDAARGAWLAFLDHDDLWAPTKLARQLDAARRADASFVYSGGVRVNAELAVLGLDGSVPEPDAVLAELLWSNPIAGGGSGPIAAADLVRAVGGFDPCLSLLEDWDMWIRLAAAGRSAACPDIVVAYLVHPGNMPATLAAVRRELRHIVAKHGEMYRAAGARVNGIELFRWVAAGQWRARRRWAAAIAMLYGIAAYPSLRDIGQLITDFGHRAVSAPPPPLDWLTMYR
jgi:glycosyltransferase involved in cell wall biosynthesis